MSTVTAPETAGGLPEAAAAAAPSGEARLFTSTLVLLSLGHFAVDFYGTAVATLQPVLSEHYGLTLTQAGFIGSSNPNRRWK